MVRKYAPVIEEPVVNTGGVEQVEAGQSPDHVTREEVPETDHAVLTPVLHQAAPLTRSENRAYISITSLSGIGKGMVRAYLWTSKNPQPKASMGSEDWGQL